MMTSLINKYLLKPIKNKLNHFVGFILYMKASIRRKSACRIRDINIKNTNVMIKFTVLYKPVPHNLSPHNIILDKALLPRFSPEEAAMIGLLSVVELHTNKEDRKKQIEKIKTLFPKLKEHIHDDDENEK